MTTGYLSVFIFFLVAVAFAVLTFAVASLLRPHRPLEEKSTTYECGEEPIGDSWVNIDVHYYIVGLLFVVFDVEAVFLLPWALVIRQFGLFAVVEGAVFLAILGVGLAYAWMKGALEWVS
jgi:NADH-quinone oxidoreductase subunit A